MPTFEKKENWRRLRRLVEDCGPEFFERFAGASATAAQRDAAAKWLQRNVQADQPGQQGVQQATFAALARGLEMPQARLARELGVKLDYVPREADERMALREKSWRRFRSVFRDRKEICHAIERAQIDELPDEMHLAIASLYSLWQTARNLDQPSIEPNNRDLIYLIHTAQSHTEFRPAQDRLAKAFGKIWKSSAPFATHASDDFGVTVSPDTGLFFLEAYLFPFTMVRARRCFFGVLPYGRQTTTGFILHKNHGAYESFADRRNGFGPLFPAAFRRGRDVIMYERTEKESLSWMADLIELTAQSRGKVFSVAGDVQFSILMDALHQNGSHNKAIDKLGSIQSKLTRHGDELDRYFDGRKLGRHGVFVFDPWELPRIARLHRDYRCVVCPHGLRQVYVGVGFSLNLLPKLIQENRWQQVWTVAFQAYRDYEAELRQIGVELLTEKELTDLRMPPSPK